MNSLVPGCFTTSVIRCDVGELEARLSEGGHWQVKVRIAGEEDLRLVCMGHLEGGVFAPFDAEEGSSRTRVARLIVDPDRRCVSVAGRIVELKKREFDLVATLASEPGRLFTNDELLEMVWGAPGHIATRTLATHASNVRCKLRAAGADGFIVNYRGHGYKLCDTVALEAGAC